MKTPDYNRIAAQIEKVFDFPPGTLDGKKIEEGVLSDCPIAELALMITFFSNAGFSCTQGFEDE